MNTDSLSAGVGVFLYGAGGTAASVGFQKGDVIAAVNNEKVARTRDLDRIAKDSTRRWAITLVRGGQTISVQFGG